ncbi:hypothetical protein HanXRQr2_Chr09g0378011 [Helianthus annuus]|uniref:Uncharacterized protein n=1 Tax=Helianthus annuus TaxID=4232 RepID=A0A9K3N7R8_HELAN|nr:hypothetical protein HanXRQr2_Chr09g0378011 [Helianthus annuus]KAJ0892314.1 hypothetical protein HanPSC8_Chr09g0364421 [Helianthus annuus]
MFINLQTCSFPSFFSLNSKWRLPHLLEASYMSFLEPMFDDMMHA